MKTPMFCIVGITIQLFCNSYEFASCNYLRDQGCTITIDGQKFFQFGTIEYQRKSNQLKLNLEKAKHVAIESTNHILFRHGTVEALIDNHRFIIDDQYLFPYSPKEKPDIPISGIFVDGNTGEVIIKPVYRAIHVREIPHHVNKEWESIVTKRLSNSSLGGLDQGRKLKGRRK